MAGGQKIGETNNLSYIQKDLLQSFDFSQGEKAAEENNEAVVVVEEEGIELSLGLSLNGSFGVDPKRDGNIFRASSVLNFPIDSNVKDCERSSLYAEYGGVLIRRYSLPVETEEWRKRKELQSLKRLEAKRKRMEKLKNGRVVREKVTKEIVGPPTPKFTSQGSIGSLGSCAASSGVSDLESREILGSTKPPEKRSPASGQCSIEQRPGKPTLAVIENPSTKSAAVGSKDKDKETEKKVIGHMPCVSTMGDGTNGTRINGFLYRYGNGEGVKIMCVCHGSFLSPAEFVKHGGGGDVKHPLQHIVINPSLL